MTLPNDVRSDAPAWWRDLLADLPPGFRDLRVGVYGSGGAPYHHAALLALWGLEPVVVRAGDVRAGAHERLDALIFPGGGATAMAGMLAPLGVEGAAAVRRWVAGGGAYLGSCAGSFLPAAVGEGYWDAHPEARELHMVAAPLANGADSAFAGLTSPGVGTLTVERSDPGHWLVAGLPDRFEIVHYNGPLFDLTTTAPSEARPSARGDEVLAAPEGALRPTGATAAFTPSECFLTGEGDDAPAETLFDRCVARGAHNGIAVRYGGGRVVLFGSHPEFGFDALQLGWGPAARLIANALARQAEDGAARGEAPPAPAPPEASDEAALRAAAAETAAALERSAERFGALRDADTGGWLEPGRAASFLGRGPAELWREATGEAAAVARLAAAALHRLVASGRPLAPAARWLDDPPRADQDFGFVGLAQLAARIEGALETAERRLGDDPVDLAHAYDRFGDHPYQLAAGSYLSAAGLTAGAALAATVAGALCGAPDATLTARLLADPRRARTRPQPV